MKRYFGKAVLGLPSIPYEFVHRLLHSYVAFLSNSCDGSRIGRWMFIVHRSSCSRLESCLIFGGLCRPGRMEVQIEIGLPDEKGRIQILTIHSNKMKENSFLGADVDLRQLGKFLIARRICQLIAEFLHC